MNVELSPYLLPYVLSLAVSIGASTAGWRRRQIRGAYAYGWAALGQALWTFGYIFELVRPTLQSKHFWDDFQWIGACLYAVAFPVAILDYSRIKGLSTRRMWLIFAVVPAAFIVVLLSPALHPLIHGGQQLIPGTPFDRLVYPFTPLVQGMVLYSFLMYLFVLFVLVREYRSRHRLYRTQIAIILFGVSIPLIGTGLTTAGVEFPGQRDIAPITFAAQNLVMAWGLYRYRIFDIIPIARDRVIEKMPDLVVVLDAQDRVVDLNPAAELALGANAAKMIGRQAGDALESWPELVEKLAQPDEERHDVTLQARGDPVHYEVKSTSLLDREGRPFGRVFVSRDVTRHVELEQRLARLNDELEQRVQERTAEAEHAYTTSLEGWTRTLELRDAETEGHSRRVTDLTLELARRLAVPEEDLEHIRRGAVLHDIGKMAIPDEILRKSDTLTFEEWGILSRHPAIAHDLLAPISFLARAIDIPYCHHEHWDGTGYPRGLQGEEIPLAARIFAVVDVWDAIQSDRPYKDGWPRERAVEYIRSEAGRQFDPRIAAVFLEMVEESGAPGSDL